MKRRTIQRVVTLALEVLDRAAYASATQKVDTTEVRLALAALWCVLEEREWLSAYWDRAQRPAPHPWETCRHPYHGIEATCRSEGWEVLTAGRVTE